MFVGLAQLQVSRRSEFVMKNWMYFIFASWLASYVNQGRGITRFFYCGSCHLERNELNWKIHAFISELWNIFYISFIKNIQYVNLIGDNTMCLDSIMILIVYVNTTVFYYTRYCHRLHVSTIEVTFRPILYRLSHRMLCIHWDSTASSALTCKE